MLDLVPALPEDEDFLLAVYASTRREEVALWGWDAEKQAGFLRMQFSMQRQSYELQFPGADQRLILTDGHRAGRLILHRTPTEIRVVDIALLPEYRGAGIGTRVIQGLQAEAAAAHLPLRLSVDKSNPARRLYERLGFRLIGENESRFAMEWRDPKTKG